MKLVINIPDRVYSYIQKEWADISPEFDSPINHVMQGIKNGTPCEERPKGKWIKEKKGCLLTYRCSNCKKIVYSREVESDEKFEDLSRLDSYKYCPRCGADMRSTTIKGKCIGCSCKTDTCQEGLHCPRD